MKHTYQKQQKKNTYYVVALENPKRFDGIIGAIDLYTFHMLLTHGTTLLQEPYNASKKNQIDWYAEQLKEQEIHVKSTHLISEGNYLIIVDTEKTNVDDYMNWRDIESTDDSSVLAWRSYSIPCHAGTKKEALGFWVCAQKESYGQYTLANIIEHTFRWTV